MVAAVDSEVQICTRSFALNDVKNSRRRANCGCFAVMMDMLNRKSPARRPSPPGRVFHNRGVP